MDKLFLTNHIIDPNWEDVVQLYSGLFDTQQEREEFIIDLAQENILLVSECKTTSIESENSVISSVTKIAYNQAANFVNPQNAGNSIWDQSFAKIV